MFHHDCSAHFVQFFGLVSGGRRVKQRYQVIWFSMIWSIWLARNRLIFDAVATEIAEVVDSVKWLSWRWLAAKGEIANYPLSSWFQSLAVCLVVYS